MERQKFQWKNTSLWETRPPHSPQAPLPITLPPSASPCHPSSISMAQDPFCLCVCVCGKRLLAALASIHDHGHWADLHRPSGPRRHGLGETCLGHSTSAYCVCWLHWHRLAYPSPPGMACSCSRGSTRFVVRTLNSRFPSQIHDPSIVVVAAAHFDSFHSIHGLLPRVLSPSALPSLLNLTARSSAHMRTAHSCGLRCPLHPSPPPQGRPNPEEALTVVQSPARALRAERRMPREPGTPCCSEAWRRSKHAALPRRGTRSPMARPGVEGGGGHGQHCAQQGPKVPSPMPSPPTPGWTAFCTRGGVGPDSIVWNSSLLAEPSPFPPPTSHLPPPTGMS